LTSIPPFLRIPFGLWPVFPPLQRPFRRSFSLLLDFLRASRRFDVQFSALAHSFWTSSCLPAALTSNPRLWLALFGLPRAFPPLQRPISALCSPLLDFGLPSHRFNVQSAVLTNPFWTLACLSAASTFIPPRQLIPLVVSQYP
jgi:hypothetical protein